MTIGGKNCRVVAANLSHVTCVAPVAANLVNPTSVALAVSVRGAAATCAVAPNCDYGYSLALTPIIQSASVVSAGASQWTVTLGGTFGSGGDFPASQSEIWIGGLTPCVPSGSSSASSITCVAAPPLAGSQVVSMYTPSWGAALGQPNLPTIQGVALSTTGITPLSTTLAGGATLTISGGGFSATDTSIQVCDRPCEVTSISSTAVTCTAPSLLTHATGTQTLTLREAVVMSTALSPPPPPTPPPPIFDIMMGDIGMLPSETTPAPPPELLRAVALTSDQPLVLSFGEITPSNLPRGATLTSATMQVTPLSGRSGAALVDIAATVTCGSASSSGTATVEWDVQPYDMGFEADQTADLTTILAADLAAAGAAGHASCAIELTMTTRPTTGVRFFHGPNATDVEQRPRLVLAYEPPSTAEQLGWTSDSNCQVTVAVPTPLAPGDTCVPFDAAAAREVIETTTCPVLRFEAKAATTSDVCELKVNGADLFRGCGLDRLVVGKDGVCAAVIDAPDQPRAACFDTKTEGVGAEELASWIDGLPNGATAMIVSCSRLAFGHNRPQLAAALATLGAADTPAAVDDAYALVGIKGGATPLAEARTACCANPNPVCATCDDTRAVASAEAACGAALPAQPTPSVLSEATFGAFGSDSYVSAIGAVASAASGGAVAAGGGGGPTTAVGAIGAMQAEDVDVRDMVCSDSQLAQSYGARHGAHLATDGDASSYWMTVGAPDAVLTVDLGSERRVSKVSILWQHAAQKVMALYSSSGPSDPNAWSLGAANEVGPFNVISIDTPLVLTLSEGGANAAAAGVSARYIRLYMSNANQNIGTLPAFAIRELGVESCALPEAMVTLGSQVSYTGASTPIVTSIAPRAARQRAARRSPSPRRGCRRARRRPTSK